MDGRAVGPNWFGFFGPARPSMHLTLLDPVGVSRFVLRVLGRVNYFSLKNTWNLYMENNSPDPVPLKLDHWW